MLLHYFFHFRVLCSSMLWWRIMTPCSIPHTFGQLLHGLLCSSLCKKWSNFAEVFPINVHNAKLVIIFVRILPIYLLYSVIEFPFSSWFFEVEIENWISITFLQQHSSLAIFRYYYCFLQSNYNFFPTTFSHNYFVYLFV